jgi:hypothetical protein
MRTFSNGTSMKQVFLWLQPTRRELNFRKLMYGWRKKHYVCRTRPKVVKHTVIRLDIMCTVLLIIYIDSTIIHGKHCIVTFTSTHNKWRCAMWIWVIYHYSSQACSIINKWAFACQLYANSLLMIPHVYIAAASFILVLQPTTKHNNQFSYKQKIENGVGWLLKLDDIYP